MKLLPTEIKELKMQELRAYAKEQGVIATPTDTKETLQAKVLGVSGGEVAEPSAEMKPSPIIKPLEIEVKEHAPTDARDLIPDGIRARINQLQEERGLSYDIDVEAKCITFFCGQKMQCENLKQPSDKILKAAESVCSRIITPEMAGITGTRPNW